MGHRLPNELLQELRTYLQHFDHTGHLGASDAVDEIKSRLQQRIREVEAQVRTMRPNASAPNGSAQNRSESLKSTAPH